MSADLTKHCLANLPPHIPDAFEQMDIAKANAFLADCGRYASDPDYRAEVDADRAARQAEVHARMDAAVARYWAARGGVL